MQAEAKNVYSVLRHRGNWGEMFTIVQMGSSVTPLSEERIKSVLELVPLVFDLTTARNWYPIYTGLGVRTDEQRAALNRVCTGMEPQLEVDDVAGILNRACWRVQPEELV